MSGIDIAAAELRAAAARERMAGTVATLQDRLSPATLARSAARDLADATTSAAQAGVDTARRNPAAIGGMAALAGLFLARNHIRALWRPKT
jgi:hypothetical protein